MDKNKIRTKLSLLFTSVFMAIGFLTMFSMRSHPVSAFATGDYTPVVTVENKTVRRGQTFTVDVDLSHNEGLISLRLILDYDKAAMELINVEQGNALNSLTYTNTNTDTDLGMESYHLFSFGMVKVVMLLMVI